MIRLPLALKSQLSTLPSYGFQDSDGFVDQECAPESRESHLVAFAEFSRDALLSGPRRSAFLPSQRAADFCVLICSFRTSSPWWASALSQLVTTEAPRGNTGSHMAFRAGSGLLSASAVADRLRDRGKHFHIVPCSLADPQEHLPTHESNDVPVTVNGYLTTSPIPSQQQICDPISCTSTLPMASRSPSSFPKFMIRPPTISPDIDCVDLNRSVHLEWLKGRGSSWIPGAPSIEYVTESNTFQLNPPDPSLSVVSESALAAALDTLEDAALDECVARHLTEGGDDRLHLFHPGAVNKYYCPSRPVPDSVAIRSSCTCSPPSRDGFDAARSLLRKLWQGGSTYQEAFDETRRAISETLACQIPHQVVLHPSGSDAELIPLLVADIRARQLGCTGIVNIVVAAGEVGSGTALAAGGRHFSKYTPSGTIVEEGSMVEGFPSAQVVGLKPRLCDGNLIPDYDSYIIDAISSAEKEQNKPFFIVHAVDGSKTGLRLPSLHLLESIRARLGERVLIVMDACQCRSDAEEIDWFLARNCLVLVTASKFFGAPGFCGGVLIPEEICTLLANHSSPPVGLRDYLTRYEVPCDMKRLHEGLLQGPLNIGLLLRWACGIAEMKLFAEVGQVAKDGIRQWVHGIRKLVRARSPKLELIDVECKHYAGDETRTGGVNSVVSIKFLTTCGTKHINSETLKKFHLLLTMDATNILPSYASEEDRRIASFRCVVGQPVKLGSFAVLRLAVGAPLAREIACKSDELAKVLKTDEKILDKMIVLARFCGDID